MDEHRLWLGILIAAVLISMWLAVHLLGGAVSVVMDAVWTDVAIAKH